MRKQTIFLIEDDAPSREMLKSLLEDLNYQILESENGRQALALAIGNQADLVLTDFGLPDMDGAELIRQLRKVNANWTGVPIVMVTGSDRDDYYAAAVAAGCTEFFSKPTDFERLEATIEQLLRQPHPGKQNQQTNQSFSYLSDYAVPA